MSESPNEGIVERSKSDRNYKIADERRLWTTSMGVCMNPDCEATLIEFANGIDPASTRHAKIAHIFGSSSQGPRPNPLMPLPERDAYDNLILLCATCADKIDGQYKSYPATRLKAWREEREQRFFLAQAPLLEKVEFPELAAICNAVLSNDSNSTSLGDPTEVDEKLIKNGLSTKVRFLITQGLNRASVVRDFLSEKSELDYKYEERLRSGFRSEYYRLHYKGKIGDELFMGMLSFAGKHAADPVQQLAGLAVLTYLFHACDVFEA